MSSYRPSSYPTTTPTNRTRTPATPRTPHRLHVTWDLTCDRCTEQMGQRQAHMAEQATRENARTMSQARTPEQWDGMWRQMGR